MINHRLVNRLLQVRTQGNTTFASISGRKPNPTLPPVISLHGWPNALSVLDYLKQTTTTRLNALCAYGYTVHLPFTGSNWGREYPAMYPAGSGGGGTNSVDDVITAIGNPGEVLFYSASMGGLNTLNWGWRNPLKVAGMYLVAPCVNIMDTYDTALADALGVRASMLEVFEAADRPALVTNTASYDPSRNTESVTFGATTKVFGVSGDEVVPQASLTSFCSTIGATLSMGSGSHFFIDVATPEWDEFDAVRWFASL